MFFEGCILVFVSPNNEQLFTICIVIVVCALVSLHPSILITSANKDRLLVEDSETGESSQLMVDWNRLGFNRPMEQSADGGKDYLTAFMRSPLSMAVLSVSLVRMTSMGIMLSIPLVLQMLLLRFAT